jgi:putative membrane protein
MYKDILLIIKGIAMGVANVIPGVSGGTIAMITEIFEELIHALKAFDITAIRFLLKRNWKGFAHHIHLKFLLLVFTGAFISLFSLSVLFTYLFDHFPVHIWSFFFGAILASIYYVGKTITRFPPSVWIVFLLGIVGAVVVALLTPGKENDNFLFLIFCGAVSVSGMVLPGISGSFLLILLGNYQLIMLEAVSKFNVAILFPVGIGTAIGLTGLSHILSYILKKFPNQTIALLTGFIAGSLYTIWPWKQVISTVIDPDGKVIPLIQRNVWPWDYTAITGKPEFLSQAILWMIVGVFIIWILEYMANRKTSNP